MAGVLIIWRTGGKEESISMPRQRQLYALRCHKSVSARKVIYLNEANDDDIH